MAVTIDEMHVDVKEPQAAPGTPPAGGEAAKKEVDLREALHLLHERKSRLQAD